MFLGIATCSLGSCPCLAFARTTLGLEARHYTLLLVLIHCRKPNVYWPRGEQPINHSVRRPSRVDRPTNVIGASNLPQGMVREISPKARSQCAQSGVPFPMP